MGTLSSSILSNSSLHFEHLLFVRERRHLTNNRCSKCNDEFDSIEELRVHERNCYICEQCNSWYESREDLEDHKNEIHSKECEENLECECDQCGKWLVQEKKDKESINRKIVPKK